MTQPEYYLPRLAERIEWGDTLTSSDCDAIRNCAKEYRRVFDLMLYYEDARCAAGEAATRAHNERDKLRKQLDEERARVERMRKLIAKGLEQASQGGYARPPDWLVALETELPPPDTAMKGGES